MGIPTKVLITLAIILGVGLGTGCLVFGICGALMRETFAGFVAMGSALLAASIAAGIAHASAGFRDWDDDGP